MYIYPDQGFYLLVLINIQGVWVNFAKNQLFCLLGPNGAGKTTTINCLTGITPVTGGDGNMLIIAVFTNQLLVIT